eukprot:352294-Chlamydomonas_euryale.AAC.1
MPSPSGCAVPHLHPCAPLHPCGILHGSRLSSSAGVSTCARCRQPHEPRHSSSSSMSSPTLCRVRAGGPGAASCVAAAASPAPP